MVLTDEQKKEIERQRKRSASYKIWYDQNKARVAQQRKTRYANDPEYKKRILENRKKQREKEKEERGRREVKGNVLENRSVKQFKVTSPTFGSCVTQFYSIGQMAKKMKLAVPTMRKWEREGIVPDALYRSKGGHRLYTLDQVTTIKIVYEKYFEISIQEKRRWTLSAEFRKEMREQLALLELGIKKSRYEK